MNFINYEKCLENSTHSLTAIETSSGNCKWPIPLCLTTSSINSFIKELSVAWLTTWDISFHEPISKPELHPTTHWSVKYKKSLPVKVQGDSYSFDTAASEYDNQVPYHPPILKERILN